MAVFAPNFNEKNVTDVFVYGFWTYNNQQKTLVPLGMTFENRADLGGEVVGFPNPVILRMSKQEYLTLELNYESNLVDQVWNNIKKQNPVIDTETGKTLWEYSINIDSTPRTVPSDLTESFDLIGDETSLTNIKLFIYGLLFGEKFLIQRGPRKYRLESIPAIEVNFDANNLLKTYCRYKDNGILALGGNLEDVGTFFDCGTILPFEENFLSPVDLNIFLIPALLTLNTFIRRKIIINNKEIGKDEPLPNCNRCFRWKVFCGDCGYIARSMILGKGIGNDKGLIISPADDGDFEEDIPDDILRYFRSLEAAKDWVQRTIKRLTVWACCQLPDVLNDFKMENRCLEISKACEGEDAFEDTYNSKEECEEDCGKKWFCINGKCVRRFPDDPEVEGLEEYDIEEDCSNNCEDESEEPYEEEPYEEEPYEEEPYEEEPYEEEPYEEEPTATPSEEPYEEELYEEEPTATPSEEPSPT